VTILGRREDVLAAGGDDVGSGRNRHQNCASSVEPVSASVELAPPDTAAATASK
jgi:hypothetical protein